MPSIQYIGMKDHAQADNVMHMMNRLYAEDQAASEVDPTRFPETIRTLLTQPERGQILLFCDGQAIHGYALLIPYWSNEYGGNVLFVDELFVIAGSRGRGIGRGLFAFIAQERPFDAVALFLEVSAINHRARKLYESLGMQQRTNTVLTLLLS
jgi:GNAT superfamily N-acetyltransferase